MSSCTNNGTDCIHPLKYFLDFVSKHPIANATFFSESFTFYLEKGIIIPNCNFCCPDCNEAYVLGSVETMLKFAEAAGITYVAGGGGAANPLGATEGTQYEAFKNICCSNAFGSLETWVKYAEAMGMTQASAVQASPSEFPPTNNDVNVKVCCNTNFNSCFDELSKDFTAEEYDRILDKGIVEYSTINQTTSLCLLSDFLKECRIDNASIVELLDLFMDIGFVAICNPLDGNVFMGGVEASLQYMEGSLTPGSPIPA
jgi:hypothetical protein